MNIDPLQRLREALVQRYAFERELGRGGLARIYLLVGEPSKALDRLEPLLKIPYFLSPAWLRIDPPSSRFGATRGSSR